MQMRDLTLPDWLAAAARLAGRGMCGAARALGRTARAAVDAVNPDVWREVGFVSLSAYSLALPKREAVADRGPDDRLPVVLVHGLGGNRGTWTPLRLFLQLHGHRRIYAFGFEGGEIEQHAADLKQFVAAVRAATGADQVDVVAHSLGGLISRWAIQRLDMAPWVRILITLATPHQGTHAAHYANTSLTVPMRPDSALLRELNGDDWTRTGVRLTAVCSDRDVYVVPREMMTHPAAENVFLPGLSHSQYLLSARVFRVVEDRLAPEPPVVRAA
jgi:hypothetical protein